jgi:DNA-binding transcriptional regulator YiaG
VASQDDTIDVAAIRRSAGRGKTQAAFAKSIGVSVRTLRNWEQRRRRPTGSAVVLLSLISSNPGIILKLGETDSNARPGLICSQRAPG